ncbi:hypothetical protein Taro_052948 [Colocasia esculenta]|uniref:Uncharacterized protein n=1 Tax=Colocasia esculenta TaxID=4460 RepID=A0A843XKS2_COLES|nr:hypothetical protein [Colocasia esculenta]
MAIPQRSRQKVEAEQQFWAFPLGPLEALGWEAALCEFGNFHLSTGALRNTKPELCPGLPVCICRQALIRRLKSSLGDLHRLEGTRNNCEASPTPVCNLLQHRTGSGRHELNGQLASVKIPGWQHDLMPLTHVGGSIYAAKFNRLWLLVVGVVPMLVRMSRGERRGMSSRPWHSRVLQFFLHHRLWIMEHSCKAWCRLCRHKRIPRRHPRLS